MKQFIYLFSGLLLLFASTPRVVAQEIGDYSQLNDEDYSKIDLPPLSVLFENAKNNPIYELADAKTAIERKLLQKEKWAFLGFFSLRGSYQYGMFGNESTYTDVAIAPYLTYSTQAQNGYTLGAGVSIPLNDLFDLKGRVSRQRLTLKSAQLEQEIKYDEIKKNIIEMYAMATSQIRVLQMKSESLILANVQYEISEKNFANGTIESADLSTDKERQSQAREAYEKSKYELTKSLMILDYTKIKTEDMNFVISTIQTLFRHRWLLLIGTTLFTLSVIYYTRHMQGGYDVKATLYTGVASGYNLESDKRTDWATVQNSMDNLISIMQAESTLKRVCLRLFARVLIQGNPDRETNGITVSSYTTTYNHLKNSPNGNEILKLIDKSSEDKTVSNLEKYMRPHKENYIYGLFYYIHPFYSYNALKNIKVQRRLTSDLLDISYSSSDPGIAYNTVSILMDEFVEEYRRIRYGETDKVIKYFDEELKRIGKKLSTEEEDLTKYNVEKRVINYLDETKEIAAINKEYALREQDAMFALNSSRSMLDELERHMDSNAKQIIKNMEFVGKIKEASDITGRISEVEAMSDSNNKDITALNNNKKRLSELKKELSELTDAYVGHKYSKEGVLRTNIIDQWLEQTLLYEKAKAELLIAQNSRQELNERYVFFAPVGTTIKQKERMINFTERNYLTVLHSYNEALLRKKNLEMTSATLKVLNEPTYPISPHSTNRKQIVIAACIGSFLIIVALLLLIEMLDRTLRDAGRTKRVTGYKVVGAVPSLSASRYGGLTKTYVQHSASELTNSLLRFLDKRKSPGVFIINLFSINEDSDEETIGNLVCGYMQSRMLNTRFITHGVDFNTNSTQYLLAKNITDFYTLQGEDILIVAYPPLSESSIPSALLHDANANILIASANHGWKTFDKQLCDQLMVQLGTTDVPFRICLTNAGRGAVEDFTGQLPPYTLLRKIGYHLSQLSLTEKIIFNFKNKAKEVEDEDDE